MRRLPKIMFATGATIIVVVALLVSALRMMLPLINEYRPQIVAKIQSVSGIPLDVGFMQGTWETFGPTLELRDIRAQMPKADLQVQRVTLALDVWQSLLHWRWQFRDLTFYQLQLDLHTTLDATQNNGSNLETGNVHNIFLRQLDRFDLRNSRISFLTPSGPRAELEIPQLTWLNSSTRHRAEGQISLSTINGQHGVVQVRMDLHDNQGILNNGTVYMQADNIDLKPWISRWLQNNTGLDNAEFSLAAWLSIKSGEVYRGNVLLSQGQANWTVGSNSHQLSVDNFVLEGRRQGNGWQIDAPVLNLKPMVKPGRKGAYRPFGYRRIPNLLALSSVKNYVFEPAIFSWNGLGRCYPPCHLLPQNCWPAGQIYNHKGMSMHWRWISLSANRRPPVFKPMARCQLAVLGPTTRS